MYRIIVVLIVSNSLVFSVHYSVSAKNHTKDTSDLLARVDKRIELLSIVFRLAGNAEYNHVHYKSYVQSIHNHFDTYSNHELIIFAKELKRKNGIGYDAVMAMSIQLEQPPSLKPLIPFSVKVPEKRWDIAEATKFVSLLQQFYVDARCEEFFKNREELYHLAEDRFKQVTATLDIEWYKQYYGIESKGDYNIVISLSNGGNNYGPSISFPDGNENIYSIMGTWTLDAENNPLYEAKNYLPTLVHEFNHSYINPLVLEYEKNLKNAGTSIFKSVENEMSGQAYGAWQTTLQESLVRSAVIRYLIQHSNTEEANKETVSNINRGFVWIKENTSLLETYENNRKKYPTLKSFMPEIISFYNNIAGKVYQLKDDFEKLRPRVASIKPFENNASSVEPGITEIEIVFDRPLSGKGYSINYGSKGQNHFPITGVIGYNNSNTSVKLKVTLKPLMEYQFIVTGNSFKTPEGYPLINYEVNFKTN